MTAHAFAVGVLQWLIVTCVILGIALLFERFLARRHRRKEYRMKFDYADDRRKAAKRNASIR